MKLRKMLKALTKFSVISVIALALSISANTAFAGKKGKGKAKKEFAQMRRALKNIKSLKGKQGGTKEINNPSKLNAIANKRFPLDVDNDGLNDLVEAILGSKLCSSDSDNDGIIDGDEVKDGLDPTDDDTDGDGIDDKTEKDIGSDPKDDKDDGLLKAEGQLTSIGDTEITVGALTCKPTANTKYEVNDSTASKNDFAVGDNVELKCLQQAEGSLPIATKLEKGGSTDSSDDSVNLQNAGIKCSKSKTKDAYEDATGKEVDKIKRTDGGPAFIKCTDDAVVNTGIACQDVAAALNNGLLDRSDPFTCEFSITPKGGEATTFSGVFKFDDELNS